MNTSISDAELSRSARDLSLLLAGKRKQAFNKLIPLQKIFYGAPGVGKSHEINAKVNGHEVIRTTFHPDSDYSTFVGAYKPIVEKRQRVFEMDNNKRVVQGALDKSDKCLIDEDVITYKFQPQVFIKAYINAWRKLAEQKDAPEPVYLIIEEINRGNCAQIFGDMFQLLDREDDGYSSYSIDADQDLLQFLQGAFNTHKDNEGNEIPGLDLTGVELNGRGVAADEITKGKKLLLPPNLYIWATMNTSDQSLFPIDSAFKRRWEWEYFPIKDAHKDWRIKVNDNEYEWWTFLKTINNRIRQDTLSSDKQLGYFFCKPNKGNTITEERFVNKIVYYLWSDVYKDIDDSDLFPEGFVGFFGSDGDLNNKKIIQFLEILGVNPTRPTTINEPASDTQSSNGEASQENHSAIDTSQS